MGHRSASWGSNCYVLLQEALPSASSGSTPKCFFRKHSQVLLQEALPSASSGSTPKCFSTKYSHMIEVVLNDRLGKKVKVKCNEDDTIGDLKKLVAAQTGTRSDKIRIQKWYNVYKDHITLKDYEIHDGMGLELYYN
ncbi:unnamed protein product [Prunus armeniaca]|uniref:Ubiquitin-like domain-containing protein n=10 Tax=Amygdaloideae TaxID=171637 RepID=A0A6J5V5I0_PRUAR|nr:unnamed protein product [Prunus armeniaca]